MCDCGNKRDGFTALAGSTVSSATKKNVAGCVVYVYRPNGLNHYGLYQR